MEDSVNRCTRSLDSCHLTEVTNTRKCVAWQRNPVRQCVVFKVQIKNI